MSSQNQAQYVDPTASAVEHCEAMMQHFSSSPQQKDFYEKLSDYVTRKLWHQLTLIVMDFLKQNASSSSNDSSNLLLNDGRHAFLALYNQVLTPIQKKLHPLRFAQMAVLVAQNTNDTTTGKALLENLLEEHYKEDHPLPRIFVQSKLAIFNMQANANADTTMDAKENEKLVQQIKANLETLNRLPSTSADAQIVYAAHYQQTVQYYKLVGPPEAFYEQALKFLQYTANAKNNPNIETPTNTQYQQLAIDLCLAALTGDGVYNLGQVLEHKDLLALIADNEYAWLVQLLNAVAYGKVSKVEEIMSQSATQIQQQPALASRVAQVREKVALLALVELIGQKTAHERILTFTDIANILNDTDSMSNDSNILVPLDRVEWVIMRALSVHLIEGYMDQVDETVTITWVRPRVLDSQQLEDLAKRFETWADKVEVTHTDMQTQQGTKAFA